MDTILHNLALMRKTNAHLAVRESRLRQYMHDVQRSQIEEADEEAAELWGNVVSSLVAVIGDLRSYREHLSDEIGKVRRGVEALEMVRGSEGALALRAYIEEDTSISVRNLTRAKRDYDEIVARYTEVCRPK